jgi:NADH-quinone oxidoreductase subunit H
MEWLFSAGGIIGIIKILLCFVPLALIPLMIFLERKGAAYIQDRPGPNRSAITLPVLGTIRGFGFVHNFSDVVKLMMKEDFIPARAHKAFYLAAPIIPVATAVLTPALIPWFADLSVQGLQVTGQAIDSHAGLLLLFALSALSPYGVVLGSWASNSKYSLLGGLRASAMMISYEIAMGLSILGLVALTGTFALNEMVGWQEDYTWGVVAQPVAFLIFVTAMFAETGRTPFDVAEGESEIVGGFHTEYSSMKFALFFMGEYAHIVVASALISILFMGGYSIFPVNLEWLSGGRLPALDTEFIRANIGYVLMLGGIAAGLVLWFASLLIAKQAIKYGALQTTNRSERLREYGLYRTLALLGAIVSLVGGVVVGLLIGSPSKIDHAWPLWVQALTAVVQLGVVLAKTVFFCWVFVWVRWTVPRIRYDQIMSLGWKVLLNIALVNLVITVLLKFVFEGK